MFLAFLLSTALWNWLSILLLHRINQEAQADIFDFGVILLEIIRGRAFKSKNEINVLREKVMVIAFLFNMRACVSTCVHDCQLESKIAQLYEIYLWICQSRHDCLCCHVRILMFSDVYSCKKPFHPTALLEGALSIPALKTNAWINHWRQWWKFVSGVCSRIQ